MNRCKSHCRRRGDNGYGPNGRNRGDSLIVGCTTTGACQSRAAALQNGLCHFRHTSARPVNGADSTCLCYGSPSHPLFLAFFLPTMLTRRLFDKYYFNVLFVAVLSIGIVDCSVVTTQFVYMTIYLQFVHFTSFQV